MKSPEQILNKFKDGHEKYAPNTELPFGGPNIKSLKAAYGIWELMMNYPIQNLAGDDFVHPKLWDEKTLLMIAGRIQREYESL